MVIYICLPGHSSEDMKVAILEQKNYGTRIQRETDIIKYAHILDTHLNGLYTSQDFLSRYQMSFGIVTFLPI